MGKAAKTRRSEKRKSDKRKMKAQQQALYESYKKAGSNKKKKGDTAGRAGVATSKHLVANCGNVGCKRCFPDLAMPRMNAPHARLAPAVKRKKKAQSFKTPTWHGGLRMKAEDQPVHAVIDSAGLGLSPTEEAFFVNPVTGKRQ